MANFKVVNKEVNKSFPSYDIIVVRGNGYVYFDGNDGFDKIESLFIHPVNTSTEDMVSLAVSHINDSTT